MNQQIEQTDLKRTMKSRHLFMIALGGVIGTGLFMGSGQIVHNAGYGGAILAFLVGGFVMYLTMLCLGELSVAMRKQVHSKVMQANSFHLVLDLLSVGCIG